MRLKAEGDGLSVKERRLPRRPGDGVKKSTTRGVLFSRRLGTDPQDLTPGISSDPLRSSEYIPAYLHAGMIPQK